MFALDETKAVIAHPVVERCMKRGFAERRTVPHVGGWVFRDREYPVMPFLVLRELVESSVLAALAEAEGRDMQRLLILLNMADAADRPHDHARAVAATATEYAVRMQFGQDGLDSYNSFMRTKQSGA